MNISVVGRHFDVTKDVREYVESKVGKLEKFFERLGDIKITLTSEGTAMTAEIAAGAPKGGQFLAVAKGENILAALDLVLDKIERQVTKHKEKLHGHRGKQKE